MSDENPWRITYQIKPGILSDGTKTYELWSWTWRSSRVVATNTDRSVLEEAIRHLEQKP
jgi:hypothetical protein